MNIQILIAHYPDNSSEHIFASTHQDLFTQTYLQLQALLERQPPHFLPQMCGLANFHFRQLPIRLEAVAVAAIAASLPLSKREFEIAEEITRGTPPRDMASLFGLSQKTVSAYRARILDKLRVRSNAEIALRMREFGCA